LKFTHQIFLILSLIVITIPRFNWGELGPLKSFVGSKPFDIEQYITYTEYFRGEKENGTQMEGPFAYRPLVPFLASFLPYEALTSINLINLLFLIFTLFPLIGLLKLFKFSGNYLFIGGLLFVFSFPVFYYGTSGYIDSTLMAFLMTGAYLIFSKKYFLFFITFIFGMGAKETIILIIPVFAVHLFSQKGLSIRNRITPVLLLIIIYVAGMILLRKLTPGVESYLWYPSIGVLFKNLIRFKTYLSILLTFGLPGIGALVYIFKLTRKGDGLTNNEIALATGVFISILISFFSLFAAYADGRHIWTSYPFSIPLALLYLKSINLSGFLLFKSSDN